jgi:hypothetical protein
MFVSISPPKKLKSPPKNLVNFALHHKVKPAFKKNLSLTSNSLVSNIATTLSLDAWVDSSEFSSDPPQDSGLAVNHLCMHPSCDEDEDVRSSKPDIAMGARFQLVFVDYLIMTQCLLTSSTRHVFDPRFDTILNSPNREFKDSFLAYVDSLSDTARESQGFLEMVKLLNKSMGFEYSREVNLGAYGRSYSELRAKLDSDHPSPSPPPPAPPPPSAAHTPGELLAKKLNTPQRFRTISALPFPPNNHPAFQKLIADVSATISPPPLVPSPSVQVPLPPGHVFVANNSVLQIHCDAFLAPVALARSGMPNGSVFSQWCKKMEMDDPLFFGRVITHKEGMANFEVRSQVAWLRNWPFDEYKANPNSAKPMLFIGQVGYMLMGTNEHVAALVLTARHFVEHALRLLRDKKVPPITSRRGCRIAKYLLCLPVLGTGGGGAADVTGNIVRGLLKVFAELVKENDDLDICLVAADEATFVQCQRGREELMEHNKNIFPSFQILNAQKRKEATDLANLAAKKELSLFMGAGCSIGAGCPSWFELLGLIEDEFHVTRTLGDKCGWDALKMADELEKVCKKADLKGRVSSMKLRVASLVDRPCSSLLTSMLSALPVKGFITQK